MNKTKKLKTRIKTANMPIELTVHILLPVLQLAALFGIGFGTAMRDWTFWMIIALLLLLFVFFTLMLFYKLYRARLTFVTIDKDGATYFDAFKKACIQSDEMAVTLIDNGRPTRNTKYAFVHKTGDSDGGFLLAFTATDGLKKFKDCAPTPLLRFLVAFTAPDILTEVRENASDELKEIIDRDLNERKNTRSKNSRR